MATDSLPSMPEGITPNWLTKALRANGSISAQATVSSCERQQVGEGVGMMSELSRLVLDYEVTDPNNPQTLIAKYPSQNPNNREIAMSYNLYEREVRYFAELDGLTSSRSPATFLCALDGDNFIILMEDMGDYLVGDQIVGATLKQTVIAIDELAKLHGAFWQQVDQIEWIPGVANSYHATNMQNLAGIGWDNMVSIFGEFIPKPIANLKEDFLRALPVLQEYMNASPTTLTHGDFRMENLLYGVKAEHVPMAILDWQGPLLGKGLIDVALLLAQSTQTEVRRQHERSLLTRYLAGLATLNIAYDSDQAWQDYRRAVLHSWAYVAVVAGTLDTTNQRAFDWMSQMVKRQCAATDDLELAALLRPANR